MSLLSADIPGITFLKAHERLIIVLVLGVLAFLAHGKYIAYRDASDQRNTTAAQQKVQQDAAQNAQVAQQVQQMIKDNQAFAASVLATEKQLLAAQAQRDAVATKQQTVDATLPPPEVASRWQSLLQLPPLSVQPVSGGTYSVADGAARTTIQQLELIPALEGDLRDEKTIASGKTDEIARLNGIVGNSQKETGGLQQQLKDADKLCQDQIKTVKDNERKKRKWYVLLGAVLLEAARKGLTGGF